MEAISSTAAEQLTRALGHAVVRIWSSLPQDVQQHLFQAAVTSHGESIRPQLAIRHAPANVGPVRQAWGNGGARQPRGVAGGLGTPGRSRKTLAKGDNNARRALLLALGCRSIHPAGGHPEAPAQPLIREERWP